MMLVIVEDDHLQAAQIEEALKEGLSRIDVERIATESAFRARLGELREHPPDAISIDVMLRWADPSPDQRPPPADVLEQGFYRAGLRCHDLLKADATLREIPVVLYTVLDEGDLEPELRSLPSNTICVRKDSDPTQLIEAVQGLVQARAR